MGKINIRFIHTITLMLRANKGHDLIVVQHILVNIENSINSINIF